MGMLATSMREKKGTDVKEFLIHHTQKFSIHFFNSSNKKEIKPSYNFPP
jgi:type III secretory pathway component EscR